MPVLKVQRLELHIPLERDVSVGSETAVNCAPPPSVPTVTPSELRLKQLFRTGAAVDKELSSILLHKM